ncbi:MAG: hypothetical protein FJ265_13160 [Planctomycetes bacterium]|nr:hypothetical protein [Planctomycetota bacterium]
MPPATAVPRQPWPLCALAASFAAAAVLAAAWISDDGLITFRTAENLAAGEGMRWNVLDRTQTATHPLWILLLAAARLCTGELYHGAIGLGVAGSSLAVLLLVRAAPRGWATFTVLCLGALGSRAFVVYGTGGLENPLSSLLVAAFALAWFALPPGPARFARLALCGGLLVLARQDLALLVAPCLLAACRSLGFRPMLRALWLGALLVGAWYLFALVYYGTVIPTPGYGKVVAADVPRGELLAQGFWYCVDLVRRDPVTALVLLGGLAASARSGRRLRAPAVGLLLQLAYTLWVGGDFMSGRFFTAAFVLALGSVASALPARGGWPAAAVLGVAAVATGLPPWTRPTPSPADYGIFHGIGDERAYYAEVLGLWSEKRPPFTYGMHGAPFAGRARPPVVLTHAAGVPSYLNGPHVHLVDPFLCDPLLMRLPLQDPARWRIGHFKRRVPEGYLETLARGANRIRNPALARYWDALEVLLRAPLFSAERWRVLWGFQCGDYEPLLRQFVAQDYRRPPRIEVDAAELPRGLSAGCHWYDADSVVVREGGLRLRLGAARGRTLRLLVDGGGAGELVFARAGQELARTRFRIAADLPGGARWHDFELPTAATGCDAVDVLPRLDVPDDAAVLIVLEVFAVLGCELRD